jgi:methyl-accepting chemotaxis protein
MKLNLRAKILLSAGLIILIVLGTSTIVHIYDLKRNYLEALEWRSEALFQGISADIVKWGGGQTKNIDGVLKGSAFQCRQVYELNKDKQITHVAVINTSGVIVVHNDRNLQDTQITSSVLMDHLQRRELTTVLDGNTYHTLIPIFTKDDTVLGTIDVGIPRRIVDEKVSQILLQSGGLFVLFLILTFFSLSFLMHIQLTKPVRKLVTEAQQLAEGKLVQSFQTTGQGDEVAIVGTAFSNIANYLRNIAGVASHIATGVLDDKVQVRSEHDVLGKAVYKMLHYLTHVANIATRIAEGDLTKTVQVRSSDDTFGQAIQSMTEGLRRLIVQIKMSVEQIASTRIKIASLAESDIRIVEEVHSSSEGVISTMREMGASIEEVAHNMELLSASVEETSASIFQMSSSITHIASNTNNLNDQIHQTITSLENTIESLEKVVQNTDVSKQLSQETSQDAREGQEAVEQVMCSMETIHHTVTTAVDAITRFEQRSREIDTVLDVIRDITEQTSLLALNASIIAAQAGGHGRGFAVVADEIRNLATGVSTSTKDIAAIVQSLQQDTSRVVQAIHEGVEDVKQGIERTQQAQQTLQKIMTSAQQSSSVVTEIADTLHEVMGSSRNVSTAMTQVNTMIDDITMATNEQEASTRQISQASSNISDMALQIQKATTEQTKGVHLVLDAMKNVSILISQNLESSQQIKHTTGDLSSQADILVHSVDRFKMNI